MSVDNKYLSKLEKYKYKYASTKSNSIYGIDIIKAVNKYIFQK